MPPLGGIVDMRDDLRGQMALSSSIGQGIGSAVGGYMQHRRIKQEEERQKVLDQTFISTLADARRQGLDEGATLDLLSNTPKLAEHQWYQQMEANAAQSRMGGVGGERFSPSPGHYQYLSPEQREQAAMRTAGIGDTSMSATDQRQVNAMINQLDEQESEYRKLMREIENPTPITYDDDSTETPEEMNARIEESRLRLGTLEAKKESTRQMLSQSDTGRAYVERHQSAREHVKGTIDRGKEADAIANAYPLEQYIDQVPQSKHRSWFDSVRPEQGIQEAMIEYAQSLMQRGLSATEAKIRAEASYRRMRKEDKKNWFGFKKLPDGDIYIPLSALKQGGQVGQQGQVGQVQHAEQQQPPVSQAQATPITATNPKTGERIISYDGGQSWQPLQ